MAVPSARERGLRIAGVVLLGAAALFAYLVWVGHARVDAATISLVAVSGALLLCLRAMFRIVQALGRADVQIVVEHATDLGIATDRELREEKRRLLRAINELKFDHDMGKLSQADYDTVRQGFELRAIEVMRALDAGATLHPELAARIKDSAAPPGGEPAPEAPTETAPAEPETPVARTCTSCEGTNERDAKFCKHCGKELAA